MTNLEKFKEAYVACLTKVVTENPEDYLYKIEHVPLVVEKMIKCILAGESVMIGPAMKATARKLKIEATMKAVRAYLSEKPKSTAKIEAKS